MPRKAALGRNFDDALQRRNVAHPITTEPEAYLSGVNLTMSHVDSDAEQQRPKMSRTYKPYKEDAEFTPSQRNSRKPRGPAKVSVPEQEVRSMQLELNQEYERKLAAVNQDA